MCCKTCKKMQILGCTRFICCTFFLHGPLKHLWSIYVFTFVKQGRCFQYILTNNLSCLTKPLIEGRGDFKNSDPFLSWMPLRWSLEFQLPYLSYGKFGTPETRILEICKILWCFVKNQWRGKTFDFFAFC